MFDAYQDAPQASTTPNVVLLLAQHNTQVVAETDGHDAPTGCSANVSYLHAQPLGGACSHVGSSPPGDPPHRSSSSSHAQQAPERQQPWRGEVIGSVKRTKEEGAGALPPTNGSGGSPLMAMCWRGAAGWLAG